MFGFCAIFSVSVPLFHEMFTPHHPSSMIFLGRTFVPFANMGWVWLRYFSMKGRHCWALGLSVFDNACALCRFIPCALPEPTMLRTKLGDALLAGASADHSDPSGCRPGDPCCHVRQFPCPAGGHQNPDLHRPQSFNILHCGQLF